jgi:hypothetical protein
MLVIFPNRGNSYPKNTGPGRRVQVIRKWHACRSGFLPTLGRAQLTRLGRSGASGDALLHTGLLGWSCEQSLMLSSRRCHFRWGESRLKRKSGKNI